MDGLNKVMLIGNLGTEVEMRYTSSGAAVATFRLAVSRSYSSGEQRKEETEWLTIVSWNKLAELVGQHLTKGRRVFVEGRLETRSWEAPDGQKRSATQIVAASILFLDKAPNAGDRGAWRPGEDLEPDDIPFDD